MRLWCIHGPNETPVAKRRALSWADAMDVLDLRRDATLVVEAPTYPDSRRIKASAVKAASRRLIALDSTWDGEWVRFTLA